MAPREAVADDEGEYNGVFEAAIVVAVGSDSEVHEGWLSEDALPWVFATADEPGCED